MFDTLLYTCDECRLVFPFPYPSQEEMVRRHESREYAMHPYFAAGEAIADKDGLGFHQQVVTLLAARLPAGSRLLDVGAGTGDFLKLASGHFAVTGVEPSPHLARRIEQRIQCPLHVGPFEEFRPLEPFDAVVMMDIIEHTADPRRLLRQAFEVLRPGGLLFVCTVDSRSLLYQLGPLVWRLSAISAKARLRSQSHLLLSAQLVLQQARVGRDGQGRRIQRSATLQL